MQYVRAPNGAPTPELPGRKTGRKIPAGEPFAPDVMIEETERYIPDIYNTRSTLSREVTAKGPNQLDFHLEREF